MSDRTAVDFFFDPACPWTWLTSRWLVAAAEQRDLDVTWRPYSLLFKNGDGIPEEYRAGVEASHRSLRVIAALAEHDGNDAVAAFYAERGYRAFTDGEEQPDPAAVLAAAGLPAERAAAADDESYDDVIRASMDEAHRLAGDENGSPILAVTSLNRGFFGPVISAVPEGDAAGRLWDVYAGIAAVPEFAELKRSRDGMALPPRP